MESTISRLLEDLSQIRSDDDVGLAVWCENICKFYVDNPRHSYSEISQYILGEDGGVEYIYKVLSLLESVRDRLFDKQDMERKVTKLIDHIMLELTRLEYLDKMREELRSDIMQQYMELDAQRTQELTRMNRDILEVASHYTDMEERRGKLDSELTAVISELENTEKEVKKTKDNADNTRTKLDNIQKEYITILGIFASIVMAFIGGMTFSTSVLQNIANASIYRISFVGMGIVAVLINLIYILVRFIQEINKPVDGKVEYPRYLIVLNLILSAGIVFVFLAWLFQLHPLNI